MYPERGGARKGEGRDDATCGYHQSVVPKRGDGEVMGGIVARVSGALLLTLERRSQKSTPTNLRGNWAGQGAAFAAALLGEHPFERLPHDGSGIGIAFGERRRVALGLIEADVRRQGWNVRIHPSVDDAGPIR